MKNGGRIFPLLQLRGYDVLPSSGFLPWIFHALYSTTGTLATLRTLSCLCRVSQEFAVAQSRFRAWWYMRYSTIRPVQHSTVKSGIGQNTKQDCWRVMSKAAKLTNCDCESSERISCVQYALAMHELGATEVTVLPVRSQIWYLPWYSRYAIYCCLYQTVLSPNRII